MDQPSQAVHIDLLDGALRVNGQLLRGLPPHVREIFRDVCTCVPDYHLQQGLFAIPSDLLGMDFATLAMTSEHKVTIRLYVT